MREIKYRGKIDGNWWVVSASDDHVSDSWEQFWTLANRKTVGQWVGIQDKSGKDVFEDDIVRGTEGDMCIVAWEEEIDRDRYWATAYGFGIYLGSSHATGEIEIIGNTYDNPELMEENNLWN